MKDIQNQIKQFYSLSVEDTGNPSRFASLLYGRTEWADNLSSCSLEGAAVVVVEGAARCGEVGPVFRC